MSARRYMNLRQAAIYRKVGLSAISNLIRRGRIRSYVIKGQKVVLRSDVVGFVKQSPPGRTKKAA